MMIFMLEFVKRHKKFIWLAIALLFISFLLLLLLGFQGVILSEGFNRYEFGVVALLPLMINFLFQLVWLEDHLPMEKGKFSPWLGLVSWAVITAFKSGFYVYLYAVFVFQL
jgi:hypothetical protein